MKKDEKIPKTKPEKAKKGEDQEIHIQLLEERILALWVLGRTPLLCNRQSQKAKRELLFPKGAKTAAEKASSLKHDPLFEYQQSIYREPRVDAATFILMPGGAFKSAAADSAVDIPGCAAAAIRRYLQVPDLYVAIYGVPQLSIMPVRQSGIARTPDMRTRAIIPHWAARVTFEYIYPHLNDTRVANLSANGGKIRGVGDGRPEKGALAFGKYEVVNDHDPRLKAIVTDGGRAAQIAAMETPEFYDEDTRDLYEWFQEALAQRGKKEMLVQANGEIETDIPVEEEVEPS